MPTHLKKYLDYFKKLEAPGYAVLVSGDWGSGKTHQVRNSFEEDEFFYVSLFGLQSADQVHSEVFAAVAPNRAKASKMSNATGALIADFVGTKAVGGLIPGIVNSLLRKELDIDRVLVFDDLERSGLELKNLLGVINTYVEHQECNVIVIAHDDKMACKFIHTKEKIFGQTIEIEPQIDEAFDSFCSDVPTNKGGEFLKNHRDVLISLFKASGAGSLRILRHVVEDLMRLHEALDEHHIENDVAMTELVQLFAAMDIEVRNANIFEKDLRDRAGIAMKYQFDEHSVEKGKASEFKKPRLLIADEKYSAISLESNFLQDALLVEMLIKGLYDPDHIRGSLNSSLYFLKPETTPPWRLVSSFDELEDDVIENAIKKMQEQYDKREVSIPGEMLHIFGLRLMLADEGVIDQTEEQIVEGFKEYIDDLLKDNRLPPRELYFGGKRKYETSHAGYSYWRSESHDKAFKNAIDHLNKAREKALNDTFPEVTERLLKKMRADPQDFFENVCSTNNGENPYAYIPVLSHISAEDFVETWLNSPKKNWNWISDALKVRYEHQLQDTLKTERKWVIEVKELLEEKAKKAGGLKGYRIRRTFPRGLGLPSTENKEKT